MVDDPAAQHAGFEQCLCISEFFVLPVASKYTMLFGSASLLLLLLTAISMQ